MEEGQIIVIYRGVVGRIQLGAAVGSPESHVGAAHELPPLLRELDLIAAPIHALTSSLLNPTN